MAGSPSGDLNVPCRAVRQVEGHSSEGETPGTDGWLALPGNHLILGQHLLPSLDSGVTGGPGGCPQAWFPEGQRQPART